jgi:hypothetical protein
MLTTRGFRAPAYWVAMRHNPKYVAAMRNGWQYSSPSFKHSQDCNKSPATAEVKVVSSKIADVEIREF